MSAIETGCYVFIAQNNVLYMGDDNTLMTKPVGTFLGSDAQLDYRMIWYYDRTRTVLFNIDPVHGKYRYVQGSAPNVRVLNPTDPPPPNVMLVTWSSEVQQDQSVQSRENVDYNIVWDQTPGKVLDRKLLFSSNHMFMDMNSANTNTTLMWAGRWAAIPVRHVAHVLPTGVYQLIHQQTNLALNYKFNWVPRSVNDLQTWWMWNREEGTVRFYKESEFMDSQLQLVDPTARVDTNPLIPIALTTAIIKCDSYDLNACNLTPAANRPDAWVKRFVLTTQGLMDKNSTLTYNMYKDPAKITMEPIGSLPTSSFLHVVSLTQPTRDKMAVMYRAIKDFRYTPETLDTIPKSSAVYPQLQCDFDGPNTSTQQTDASINSCCSGAATSFQPDNVMTKNPTIRWDMSGWMFWITVADIARLDKATEWFAIPEDGNNRNTEYPVEVENIASSDNQGANVIIRFPQALNGYVSSFTLQSHKYTTDKTRCSHDYCSWSDSCVIHDSSVQAYCSLLDIHGSPVLNTDVNCQVWADPTTTSAGDLEQAFKNNQVKSRPSGSAEDFCTTYPTHPACACQNLAKNDAVQKVLQGLTIAGGLPEPVCYVQACQATGQQDNPNRPLFTAAQMQAKQHCAPSTICTQVIDVRNRQGEGNINISNNNLSMLCGSQSVTNTNSTNSTTIDNSSPSSDSKSPSNNNSTNGNSTSSTTTSDSSSLLYMWIGLGVIGVIVLGGVVYFVVASGTESSESSSRASNGNSD